MSKAKTSEFDLEQFVISSLLDMGGAMKSL